MEQFRPDYKSKHENSDKLEEGIFDSVLSKAMEFIASTTSKEILDTITRAVMSNDILLDSIIESIKRELKTK